VSFRDEPSQALARQIGFTGKSQVFPDNVYSLDVSLPSAPPDTRNGPVVGLAPMPWPFCDPREYTGENLQALYDEYLAKFATFASSLVRYSCSLELFGSDAGADPAAIEDLRRFCGRSRTSTRRPMSRSTASMGSCPEWRRWITSLPAASMEWY